MRMSERAEMVEVLAGTIPDALDLTDEMKMTEFLGHMAFIADYSLHDLGRAFDSIIKRAAQLREERNGPAF